ncbi:MAG: MFS transporter [Spirochaetales bacterium]|uniref:MFS transporter n=1 Tax=Candidatus Thalassospirochaeta sargassi TaxID=3119039 RepID=A0AAJ1MNQ0_9SPIO|nr:MFS transporter [Spirochaetales bacterium]
MIDDAMRTRIDRCAYATMLIYAASVNILPIALVRISEELSINLTQAGVLGFITSIEQFFVLILSIFAAARFGKIRILRVALLIMAVGLTAFAFSRSYIMALSLIIIVGFGNAMIEAVITPLVSDLHPQNVGGRMNLLHSFWPIGICIGVLVFGELLTRGVSWRALFVGVAIISVLIFMTYPGARKASLPPSRADLGHLGEILKLPRFWMFGVAMFFAGAAEFSFAYWAASYIQINFNTAPRAGAFGAAAFALGMAVGRMSVARLAKYWDLKMIINVSAVCGFLFSLTFFLINSPMVIYGYLFVVGLFIACLWPSIQSYAASVIAVDPTVLMVFLSCFGIPGTSAAALAMGIIGDAAGLRTAYIVAPVFLFLVVIFLSLEGRFGVKRQKAE